MATKPVKHVRVPHHWNEFHRETPFLHESAFMHPTRLHFDDKASKTHVEWHSRRHRKGRNFIIKHPETKTRLEDKEVPIWKKYKLWSFEFKNISWWVAQFFVWGSVSWVINGFAVWLPSGFPESRTGDDMARISALVGGALFLIGATLAYFEALNIHPMADGFRPQIYTKPDVESGSTPFSSSPGASSPSPSLSSPVPDQSSGINSPRSVGSDSPVDPNLKEKRNEAAKRLSLNLEPDRRKTLNLNASNEKRRSLAVDKPTEGEIDNNNRRSRSRPPSIQIPNQDGSTPNQEILTLDEVNLAQLESVLSDSYNPASSHLHSRANSVTSMTSASESYDSDFPDRVPTPTPPPSPPQVVVHRFIEEDLERQYTVKGSRFRELGFLASFIQLLAATIFFISCITGMHNVIDETSVGQRQGVFWTPQVVGGMGFVIASILYMYEVQPKWYKLKPQNIGWEVGFWNLIGAIGFTLCGIFGYYAFDDKYQRWGSAFSTFWGGWSFLLGSYIQLLEAINK